MKRHKTRAVKIGAVRIGGSSPIAVQGMIKSPLSDFPRVKKELFALSDHGAKIIRVAVKDARALATIGKITRLNAAPIVADIHFDYRLALGALAQGADKIRINPSNIKDPQALGIVIAAAKKKGVPIRIGVNSGSLRDRGARHRDASKPLFDEAARAVRVFEKNKFRDIVVSIKSSRIDETIAANRLFAKKYHYPIHLGITATGPEDIAVIKSAIGIGALLEEGIGDTIRVSLTGDSCREIRAAQNILQAVGIQRYAPDIISCPTCSRCSVDLKKMLAQLLERLRREGILRPRYGRLTIALMGCEVNGPGEAKTADIGLAVGGGYSMMFKNGAPLARVKTRDSLNVFVKEIKKMAGV